MPGTIDPALLEQRWIHSHEEDTASEQVFRPASYKFPPSRGRRSLVLGAGGEMQDIAPGADDRPAVRTGRWRLAPSDQLELSPSGPHGTPEQLKLVSLAADKLVVSR